LLLPTSVLILLSPDWLEMITNQNQETKLRIVEVIAISDASTPKNLRLMIAVDQ